jgi:sugar porter (SP) family MFS transporter
MYQSEIAPEAIRGRLVALQQLSITFGIFLAAAFNVGLQYWEEGWRFSYGGNGFLALALAIMVLFFPESPRWLVKQGRIEDARRALRRLRFEHEIEPELDLIIEEEKAQALLKKGTWADLFRPKRNMNYITMVGVLILFFQQLTGINAIMYFAPVIFSTFMKNGTALYANLGIMFVNFLATFIAIALVDRAGRRTLLVWGSVGMVLTTVVVCIMSGVLPYKTSVVVGSIIVVFCALYVINFAYSWGPIGWVVPAEIFPMDLRDKGMALTTTGNWLSNFAVGKVTPILIRPQNFNLWGTFLFFGAWCTIMGLFVLLFVPETKGTALELVDRLFTSFREIPVAQRLVRINMKSKLAFLHTAAGEAMPAKNPERSRDNTLETSPLPPV